MKNTARLLALIIVVLSPIAANAQESSVELAPFFGWRHGNNLEDISGLAVDFDSGSTYGFMVDVAVTRNLYVEFIYAAFGTDASIFVPAGLPQIAPVGTYVIPSDLTHYQGGILYQFDTSTPAFKPYVVGTVGAASISLEGTDGSTDLAFSVGGGVKLFASRHFGVRGEYRLFSVSTDFVEFNGVCNFFGCATFTSSEYLYQSQFSVAAIIAF